MVANVTESDSPLYHVGQPVEVKVMAYPGRVFKGKISKIYATVDPNTHRVMVRCEIADPKHELRPGMLANFVIRVQDPVESVAIPMNGVVRNGDGTMAAWVTTDRQRFVQRIVKIGLQQDGQYQVLEGLQRGRTGRDRWGRIPQQHAVRPAERLGRRCNFSFSSKPDHAQVSHCLLPEPPRDCGVRPCWPLPGRASLPLRSSTSRPIRTQRRSSWKSPRRRRAFPPRRWSVTTRIPIEIGLYTTPGIDVIRSTSFYGLSFVRVVFKYGVDYHFAYAQAAIAMQQNVTLPGNQVPQIQQNSSTGEIYRYQVVGPKHFGLTNLRTVQDWIVLRRLSTIPGIVQINSWGGTTKEFEVEVDPQKLEAYNVTVPQMLTALGNANINVGGREIRIGQQSINIRGVGLIDDGGDDDLTQGYKVDDIENVVLTQAQRRARAGEGRGQSEGGLRAAARHLRPGPGGRRGGVPSW